MKEEELKIGLFTNQPELDPWMAQEGKDIGINLISCKDDHTELEGFSAILCYSDYEAERVEILYQRAREAISQGVKVIWIVNGPDAIYVQISNELRNKKQIVYDVSISDAAEIWEQVLKFYDDWKTQNENEEEENTNDNKRIAIPSLFDKKSKRSDESYFIFPEEKNVQSLSNVIAVAGNRGAGSSFIAWNVAALLEGTLLEGQTTGTLAKWFEISEEDSRENFLRGMAPIYKAGVYTAPTSSRSLIEEDMDLLRDLNKLFVIDVGSNLENPGWKSAETKIFVTTPDVQWRDHPFPNDDSIIKVMNQFPIDFITTPDEIFSRKIDIVVPESSREVLISMYGKRPWINQQSVEFRNSWKKLFIDIQKQLPKGGNEECQVDPFFS